MKKKTEEQIREWLGDRLALDVWKLLVLGKRICEEVEGSSDRWPVLSPSQIEGHLSSPYLDDGSVLDHLTERALAEQTLRARANLNRLLAQGSQDSTAALVLARQTAVMRGDPSSFDVLVSAAFFSTFFLSRACGWLPWASTMGGEPYKLNPDLVAHFQDVVRGL